MLNTIILRITGKSLLIHVNYYAINNQLANSYTEILWLLGI